MELHIGRGINRGALTVFPVWNGAGGRRRYGTDMTSVAVTELDGGPAVPGLSAANAGDKPVLVLEGQLFEGGWQHRMAVRSVLLAPGRPVTVDVACVEHGRWNGDGRQLGRGRRATPFVRSGATAPPAGRDAQGEVWQRVSTYDGARQDPTGSFVTHLDRSARELRRMTRGLRPLPGQAGVLVAVAGQPLMLEVFDDTETLREQFDSIVAAAGLDALGQAEVTTPSRRARRLVERLERTQLVPGGLDELGCERLEGRTPDLDVSVLSWNRRPVHVRATFLRHPSLVGV